MALATYSDLKASVADFLNRTDLTSTIPDFIALAEADINSHFDLRTVESDQAVTATAGAGTMLDGCRLNLAPAANGSIDRFMFQYTWQNDKAPNLRGVAEFIGIGLNGTSMPAGGALDVALVWSEE